VQKEFFDRPWIRNGIGRTFRFLPPNVWTTLSLIIAFVALAFVVYDHLWWGIILFTISACCDFIDGKVARFTGKSSPVGAWWDGVVDRFVDALVIACFFFFEFPCSSRQLDIMLFILLFMTLLPPFIVAYANHRGAVPDPTEREVWRFAFRFEYIVLLGISAILQPVSITVSYYFLWATLVLMTATVFQSMILVFIKAKKYT
jgi:archaetidylinositol phosphate synthase